MEKSEDKTTFEADPNIKPSCTLYINNLDQSIKPNKIKNSLNTVFSAYGNVLDVHVRKSLKMRGQAFVVFDSIESAQFAMEALQNHEIFDRPMHINYSKTESDLTVKNEGRQVTREKKPKVVVATKRIEPETPETKIGAHEEIRLPPKPVYSDRSKRLFIKSVPPSVSKDRLEEIFKKQQGFVEVRYIVIKGNAVAFIEFRDEVCAEEILIKGIGQSEGLNIQFAK